MKSVFYRKIIENGRVYVKKLEGQTLICTGERVWCVSFCIDPPG